MDLFQQLSEALSRQISAEVAAQLAEKPAERPSLDLIAIEVTRQLQHSDTVPNIEITKAVNHAVQMFISQRLPDIIGGTVTPMIETAIAEHFDVEHSPETLGPRALAFDGLRHTVNERVDEELENTLEHRVERCLDKGDAMDNAIKAVLRDSTFRVE